MEHKLSSEAKVLQEKEEGPNIYTNIDFFSDKHKLKNDSYKYKMFSGK